MDICGFLQDHGEMIYLFILLLFVISIGIAKKTSKYRRYRRSEYRTETRKRRKKVEKDRGATGEYETSVALERIRGNKYFVFNAYIPRSGGKGCVETDIIMIHEKGIVVIENKNYSGIVKGRMDRTFWEHYLGGKRYTFYSPVYQNISHIRHIRSFIEDHIDGVSLIPIFSVVAFNDKIEKLKVRRKWRSGTIVCRSCQAQKKIWRRLKRQEIALDQGKMDEIYQLLKSRSQVFRWVKRNHRKQVEKNKKMLD